MDVRALDHAANIIRDVAHHLGQRPGPDGVAIRCALELLRYVERERVEMSDHALSLIPPRADRHLMCPIGDYVLDAVGT
jgi:hypothetical protein